MKWLRWFVFVLACGECAALGQSATLHYWSDAVDNAVGAVVFFGVFFAIPHISRELRANGKEKA